MFLFVNKGDEKRDRIFAKSTEMFAISDFDRSAEKKKQQRIEIDLIALNLCNIISFRYA